MAGNASLDPNSSKALYKQMGAPQKAKYKKSMARLAIKGKTFRQQNATELQNKQLHPGNVIAARMADVPNVGKPTQVAKTNSPGTAATFHATHANIGAV